MLLLSLSTACSVATFEPAAVVEPIESQVEEPAGPGLSPITGTPSVLTVKVLSGTGQTIELRPYQLDGAELAWEGSVLTSELIDSATWSYLLPDVAPDTSIPDGGDEATYAIVLRDTLTDGTAGSYLGISNDRLIWSTDETTGESTWELVSDMGTALETWLPLSDGSTIDENLVGGETVTLGGETVFHPGSETHLALFDKSSGLSAYDTPHHGGTWSLTVPGSPDLNAADVAGWMGASLSLVAYDDIDGDNTLVDEEPVGVACVGEEPAVVTWSTTAYDLESALFLSEAGLRSGWDVFHDSSDGWVRVDAENWSSLVLAPGCGL